MRWSRSSAFTPHVVTRTARRICDLVFLAQTSGARVTDLIFDGFKRFTLVAARYTLAEGRFTLKPTRYTLESTVHAVRIA